MPNHPTSLSTADLSDAHPDLPVAQPMFRDFGGRRAFHGPIATVRIADDNTVVRSLLEQPGGGRVLVVDNGGSLRCAVVGDQLAALASKNGWAGIVVHGCVRDSVALAATEVGVKALAVMPRKSEKRGSGETDLPVTFAGVTFTPGHHLYADADGIVVAPQPLPAAHP
jgi:regulator of ribonuclease activity A